jgi:hypothetical protein
MPTGIPTSLYKPLNRYKPIAPDIGIVDGGFEYMSWLGLRLPWPFTTRMTVVQLANGQLFLHSPIAFDAGLAAHLRAMGRIGHLVSPNKLHYAHIGDWSEAFPEAITWASPGVRQRARAHGIRVSFARDLGPKAPPEWCEDLDQTILGSGSFEEVAFCHKISRTLILADTMMNFELEKLGQPYRFIARLAGAYHPFAQMPLDMRLTFLPNKTKVRAAIEELLACRPGRIILSHGRCIDEDGEGALRRAFAWSLKR